MNLLMANHTQFTYANQCWDEELEEVKRAVKKHRVLTPAEILEQRLWSPTVCDRIRNTKRERSEQLDDSEQATIKPVAKKQRVLDPVNMEQRRLCKPLSKVRDEVFASFHQEHELRGNVVVETVGTHQGKTENPHSTNACAVISTAVAAYHLSESKRIETGDVKHIIDDISGNLAREIREAYNEAPFGMLEQFQVNEYFTEELGMLDEEQTPTCVGGNIMAPADRLRLCYLLDGGMESLSGKAAATFYFQGHVITILRCIDNTTGVHWFEVIDSLPAFNGNGFSCRLRNIEALEAFLLSYCVRKLPNSLDLGAKFDTNDPRLFQVFVWSE